MNKEYAEKVEVLLRLLPIVMDEKVFAVHGGSAINLFVRDLPRYSVDIDLTYIPLEGREESLEHINNHLMSIVDKAKRAFHGMHIVPKLNTSKLLCAALQVPLCRCLLRGESQEEPSVQGGQMEEKDAPKRVV